MEKNILIVGGYKGKPSGVINKLFQYLGDNEEGIVMCNNGEEGLPDPSHYDLIYWWPDIDNTKKKEYPVKSPGSVLICSKVMREDTTRVDAVSRIFAMHGNAVVMIHKETKPFQFELVDALNNTWVKTTSISVLANAVQRLFDWTKGSRRKSLKKESVVEKWSGMDSSMVEEFMSINRKLALKVADGCGNRYFGNYSTRCTKLFPSKRLNSEYFLFSPRNIDKRFVTVEDLVLTDFDKYYNERKPSVDTPIQLELYRKHQNINFMIHGHAFIDGAMVTDEYFPCGDLREVPEALKLLDEGNLYFNLKNHGFLLCAENLGDMERYLDRLEFKPIGG